MRKKSPVSKSSGGMNIGPLLSAIVIAGLRLSIDNKKALPGPATRAKKAKPVKPAARTKSSKSKLPVRPAKAVAKRPARPTNRKRGRGRKMNGGGQAEFFE
jgi:hypothetical protein